MVHKYSKLCSMVLKMQGEISTIQVNGDKLLPTKSYTATPYLEKGVTKEEAETSRIAIVCILKMHTAIFQVESLAFCAKKICEENMPTGTFISILTLSQP